MRNNSKVWLKSLLVAGTLMVLVVPVAFLVVKSNESTELRSKAAGLNGPYDNTDTCRDRYHSGQPVIAGCEDYYAKRDEGCESSFQASIKHEPLAEGCGHYVQKRRDDCRAVRVRNNITGEGCGDFNDSELYAKALLCVNYPTWDGCN